MKMTGDGTSFDQNWQTRQESLYTHWTRQEPGNQIQLAFRNHWEVFQQLLTSPLFNGGRRCLEVGCGRGSLSAYFSDAGYATTLLDLSPAVIEIARNIFAANELIAEFVVGDAEQLPFADASFDVLFSIGLLEHMSDPATTLREQVRILANGGAFFGYVVPHRPDNVQREYRWINEILKGYASAQVAGMPAKTEVFRTDCGSDAYLPILQELGLQGIGVSGLYPLPMLSHSIEFPFTLMPPESEKALVRHLKAVLAERRNSCGTHPWFCEETYGQAFLLWGFKA